MNRGRRVPDCRPCPMLNAMAGILHVDEAEEVTDDT